MGCINISCVHASMSRTRMPCSSWGAIPRFYWQSTPKLMKIPLVHCAAHHEHQHVITTASQGIFTPRGLKYFLFTGLRYSFEDSLKCLLPRLSHDQVCGAFFIKCLPVQCCYNSILILQFFSFAFISSRLAGRTSDDSQTISFA